MKIQGRFTIDTRTKRMKLYFDTDKKVNPQKVIDFIRDCKIIVKVQEILTIKQFRYIMALFTDFHKTFGEDTGYYKYYFKSLFCIMEEVPLFSCKSTTKENANNFINFIIEKGLDYGVNFSIPPYKQGINVEKYVYHCLEKKICAKCNKRRDDGYSIDLHHQETVASNGGRKVNDDELEKMPLCRECHNLAHNIGLKTFSEKYKLVGIPYPSEKWYGRKIWSRITKLQKYQEMLEGEKSDVDLEEHIEGKNYFGEG